MKFLVAICFAINIALDVIVYTENFTWSKLHPKHLKPLINLTINGYCNIYEAT